MKRFLLLSAFLVALHATPGRAATGDVRLVLPAVLPSQGAPFDLSVTIDAGTAVLGAYELRIKFNGEHLEFVSATPGTVAGFADPIRVSPTDLANGVLRIGAYQRSSRTQPTGEQTLGQLRFRALGLPGSQSTLDLTVLKLIDPLVDDLPAQAFDVELVVNPLFLGDINSDGVAYQVSDAVFFTRALLGTQTLGPTQISATDANVDGVTQSVADLVTVINVILGLQPPAKRAGSETLAASLGAAVTDGDWELIPVSLPADQELGAALFRLRLDARALELGALRPGPRAAGMTVGVGSIDGETVVLLHSLDGARIAAGDAPLLWIPVRARSQEAPAASPSDVALTRVDVSDAAGQRIRTAFAPDARPAVTPRRLTVTGNVPNPFNPRTSIQFDLPAPGRAQLAVYDVAGRRVTQLLDREMPAGRFAVEWDGVDGHGHGVASGVYFARLELPGHGVAHHKMVLVR